jgi:hypothetical protein
MKSIYIYIIIFIIVSGISVIYFESKEIKEVTNVGRPVESNLLEMVCELSLDIDGAKKLKIDSSEPSRISIAKIDFENKSGWYQGNIAISEGRAGSLEKVGPLLKITRPAMFQRFGVSVTGEEFIIDRSTGKFKQYLSVSGQEKINLIVGQCARMIRPPF